MWGSVFLCPAPEPSTCLLTPHLPWLHFRGCEFLSDGWPLHGPAEVRLGSSCLGKLARTCHAMETFHVSEPEGP